MTESGPKVCVECKGSRRFSAWWSCPECGDEVCGDDCAVAHAENCQKPPGYTCKLCGQNFEDLADFAKHATTCVRPTTKLPPSSHCAACGLPIPLGEQATYYQGRWYCRQPCGEQVGAAISPPKNEDDGTTCPICAKDHQNGDITFLDGFHHYCVKCWSAKYPEGDPPRCFGCGSTLVAEEDGGWTCLKCSPPKSPKPGGTYGLHNLNAHIAMCKRLDELEVRVEPDAAVQNIDALVSGTRLSGHHFDWALRQMLSGNRVYREDWNGRELPARVGSEGVWIAISTPDPKIDSMTRPFIYIRSITGSLVPWVPTQSALLMRDWCAVED